MYRKIRIFRGFYVFWSIFSENVWTSEIRIFREIELVHWKQFDSYLRGRSNKS